MNKIVETLGVVVEDARFEFKEDKMQATVVDASHVAMIDMKVDAAAFDTWEIEENDLALELRKVKELISLGGADDMIEMAYTKDSGVLTLNLGKIDRNIRPLDPSTVNSPTCPTSTFLPPSKSTVHRWPKPSLLSRWATWSTSASTATPSPFTCKVKPTRSP